MGTSTDDKHYYNIRLKIGIHTPLRTVAIGPIVAPLTIADGRPPLKKYSGWQWPSASLTKYNFKPPLELAVRPPCQA